MPVTLPDDKITPAISAIDENLCEHFTFIHKRIQGMRVQDSAEFLQTDSGLNSDTFNQVTRANLFAGSEKSAIRDMVSYFSMRKRPFAWWVGPSSRPLDIEKHLIFSGLKQTEEEVGMAISLPAELPVPETPAGFTVCRVTDEQELAAYTSALAANWDPPDANVAAFYTKATDLLLHPSVPMRLYLGYLNGEPAATGELFLSRRAAGLYNVATKQEFRNQGLGTSMTYTLVRDAQDEGYKLVVLQASKEGLPVYEKLGFVSHCRYSIFTPPNK